MNHVLRVFFLGCVLSVFWGCEPKSTSLITASKALAIAENSPEVKALLAYQKGALALCVQRTVTRTCASSWVTCHDNAWVVQYVLTSSCPVRTDGRLSMNFLIEGSNGKIISHYPELEYFQSPQFCRDDADCVFGQIDHENQCINFVAAPFAQMSLASTKPCFCSQGTCRTS